MDTATVRPDDLAASLDDVSRAQLDEIPAHQMIKVLRRVLDEDAPQPALDFAAFNSSI